MTPREQYEDALAVYDRATVAYDAARGAYVRARHQLDLAAAGLARLEVRPGLPRWMADQAPAGGWTAESYADAR